MSSYGNAKRAAVSLRLSANLDAVDNSRAWAIWEYLEKNPPPWECPNCDGKGFIDAWEYRCPMCIGSGDLRPEPVEPEEVN